MGRDVGSGAVSAGAVIVPGVDGGRRVCPAFASGRTAGCSWQPRTSSVAATSPVNVRFMWLQEVRYEGYIPTITARDATRDVEPGAIAWPLVELRE